MKHFAIFVMVFWLGGATKDTDVNGIDTKNGDFKSDNMQLDFPEEFFDELHQEVRNLKAGPGGIIANVNDYADKILVNIHNFIIRSGLDPVELPDQVLKFTYQYRTKVLLLSISGGADGRVQNVKVNVNLSFDFANYHASLDQFDIKDTGKISLKFTGNGLVDWITNTMTSVVTLFFTSSYHNHHPINC
ncbi:hypothetical protein NQ314_006517 [Rhamnusium bicolor]|uniref:Uncharacterized protein n=1 Tax=Rhamnusium bicolor TaxID=1586634 RepID=A0AAV8Z0R3_9CUCU|nr:hypothetical protein NQ314_006517 [Rhamnusium bicolor]